MKNKKHHSDNIILLSDQPNLVETNKFPHSTFHFQHFNPVQSRVFEVYEDNKNILVASNTNSGKTSIAEMYLSHEIKERGGKGIYLSPLKALAQEKVDDWTNKKHTFSKFKTSILTGDYRLTPQRKSELEEANFLLMTYEMLASRTRHFKSENNQFLKEVGTLVIDELHEISSSNRGSHLENAIMKFTALNPECRIVALSATMPNVDEISGWLSHIIKRPTYVLKSEYRPVPLETHFVPYADNKWQYDAKEEAKIASTLDIIRQNPDDKFLVFVHTKRTGEKLKLELLKRNIETEFHNADLDKDKRIKLENRFREDVKFRVIIATSTLSAGLNMPARRVIVVGVHCGIQEIKPSLAFQETGRAGRVKYDTQGDAYILLPKSKFHEMKMKFSTVEDIESQMVGEDANNYKTLAFHIVSEIHHKDIQDVKGIHEWYSRSLSHYQKQILDDSLVDKMISFLKSRAIIEENDQGILSTTPLGMISSLFYYPPFDVADLKQNFSKLLNDHMQADDDYRVAMALANVDSFKMEIVNSAEREQLELFAKRVKKIGDYTDGATKIGYCYYCLMNGANNPVMASRMRGLQFDFERLSEVLNAIASMHKWEVGDYFKRLDMRVKYGVGFELLDFVGLSGIGKIKASRLWQSGLKSLKDMADKPHRVKIALECSDDVLKKVMNEVNSKLLVG